MEYFKELQATKIFKDASEFECQAMMYCFKTRFVWFEKGENIVKQGDEIQDIFIILKGSAIVQNIDNDLFNTDFISIESARYIGIYVYFKLQLLGFCFGSYHMNYSVYK